ncbi:MAG: hypothetical protein ACEQSB_07570, partial [Undibacterium sp.]
RENGVDTYRDFLAKYNPKLLKIKKEEQSKRTIELNKKRRQENLEKSEYKNHKVLTTGKVRRDGHGT